MLTGRRLVSWAPTIVNLSKNPWKRKRVRLMKRRRERAARACVSVTIIPLRRRSQAAMKAGMMTQIRAGVTLARSEM